MDIEIGDRIRFNDQLPAFEHHVGWEEHENGHGWGAPKTRTWSEHFGGENGVVVSIDKTNAEATVRGRHRDGADFTVQVEQKYLTVEDKGIPR